MAQSRDEFQSGDESQSRDEPTQTAEEGRPPFPARQMLVLALCRLCEPIAFTSIFPYIYFMIEDFHETDDPNQISTYAGLMTTVFAIAEFSTGAIWGRISDKIGRKPVIVIALSGTALSMLVLGFAPNLLTAMIARVLAGLLNGNISVIQSVVGDIITEKEHQARAYMIMPLVWSIGSIIGPMVGGALARPCISYPNIFMKGSIWDRWPYLLPNLCSAILLIVGGVTCTLFLAETNARVSYQDPGLEAGNRIIAFVKRTVYGSAAANVQEPCPSQTEASAIPRATSPIMNDETPSKFPRKRRTAFNRQVVLNIVSYGILAFHTMTFDQLFPIVLSTESRSDIQLSWPFKFVDGYGMDTKEVGFILSVQGIYSLFTTAFLFPFIVNRTGALKMYKWLALTYWALYFFTPYAVLCPDSWKMVGVYAILLWRCSFSSMAYPANAILLINSVTDKASLGTVNGLAASTASLSRAFSPAVSGYLYSVGLEAGYSGLAWWANAAVTAGGSFVGIYLSDQIDEPEDDDCDEETALLSG